MVPQKITSPTLEIKYLIIIDKEQLGLALATVKSHTVLPDYSETSAEQLGRRGTRFRMSGDPNTEGGEFASLP